MKILLTLDFPPERGGIQTYLFNIVKHTFTASDAVLAGCAPRRAKAGDCGLKTPVYRVSTPLASHNKKFALIALLFRYWQLYARTPGAINVVCGNIYAAIVAWLCSFFGGPSYGIYTHAGEILALRKSLLKRRFFRAILSRAEVVYAVTRYGESLVYSLGISPRIVIFPPRIDLNDAPPKSDLNDKSRTHVLTVGRLVAHKGHDILIRAAALLPDSAPWRITCVGDGPLRGSLLALIEELRLANRVHIEYAADADRLNDLYRHAGMFAFPSLERTHAAEGYGIVLLEAMAAGLPIIASRAGGVPEVLLEGALGMLIAPGSPSALAQAIQTMHEQPALALAYANRAYHHLCEQYVW